MQRAAAASAPSALAAALPPNTSTMKPAGPAPAMSPVPAAAPSSGPAAAVPYTLARLPVASQVVPVIFPVLSANGECFQDVVPALLSIFPAERRPPPLRALPENPHAADILAAGFPTVPLASVPNALGMTACAEALVEVLPAEQGASPPWLEVMSQVGRRFPLSPALPWAIAYFCRRDDGGPAARARALRCPYWTSPACRVTVYYSPERLAHLGAVLLSCIPDPCDTLRAREATVRARVTHGCFSAVRLASLFGKELMAPGLACDEWRAAVLMYMVMLSLRHFAETVALRSPPCDEHSPSMASDLVMLTHDLFQ